MGSTHTSLPNGLVIFTCVVSITSFVLYFGTWCIGSFFSRRDRSRRSRGQDVHHDPPAITQDERGDSVGDGPRVSDVLIDSWYPLCPQLESQSGMLKPIRGKGESGKRVAASPANDWKWEKILVSSSSLTFFVPSAHVRVRRVLSPCPRTRCLTWKPLFPHLKSRSVLAIISHRRPKSKSTP